MHRAEAPEPGSRTAPRETRFYGRKSWLYEKWLNDMNAQDVRLAGMVRRIYS